MMLTHKNWQSKIRFEENIVNTIIFENKKHFRDIIFDLKNKLMTETGNFSLVHSIGELSFAKNVDIIESIFSLDINNKKITTKLLQELEAIALENYEYTSWLKNELIKFFSVTATESMYDLDYELDLSLASILKLANFKMSYNDKDLVDLFLTYCKVMNDIAKIKLIVVINIHLYFTPEELEEIYKYLLLNKINILNIQQRSEEKYVKNINEKILIFDVDYCEL